MELAASREKKIEYRDVYVFKWFYTLELTIFAGCNGGFGEQQQT